MNKIRLCLLPLLLLLAFSVAHAARPLPWHPFHISKCLVEYKEAAKAIQVSLHIFTDDLEDGLRLMGAGPLFISTQRESPKADGYIEQYLARHFQVAVNGQPAKWQYLGKETSEDLAAVWCYLEIVGVEKPSAITISNDLLMEVFDDQKNIISVFGPGGRQGMFLFEKGRAKDTITF